MVDPKKRKQNFKSRNNQEKRQKQSQNQKQAEPQSLAEKVAAAKQRALAKANERNNQSNEQWSVQPERHEASANKPEKEQIFGLKSAKIHPLLRGIVNTEKTKPTEVDNPLLYQKTQPYASREALNPYFDPTEITNANTRRKRKGLVFNEKGKYVSLANKVREKEELAKIEQEEAQRITDQGLDPDEALNEIAYKKSYPPKVEWWDEALFYRGKTYEDVDVTLDRIEDNKEVLVLHDEEQTPVTSYIQHPVPINAPWEKHLPPPKPLYLTKKELKRIRKNRRAEVHKEKQDRIKLGLDPAPAPKVKLGNLMTVLTNEAIKDPTAVEMRVRQEVEERRQKHLAENEARKLTSEQKNEKIEKKFEKDVNEKGIFSAVFRIDKLVNSQHIFKVDINAKQYKLHGICCFRDDDFALVVVEGSRSSINKYKHLLLDRIRWEENVTPKALLEHSDQQSTNTVPDYFPEQLVGNKCRLVWEGQLLDFHFQKWTMHRVSSDEDALALLSRYKSDSYWREAKVFSDQ